MTGKGTILVVDDTLASLKLLTDILTAEGYIVRPADSGELALASVASSPPDLILLDIRMPGMDGFEVCRRLKARPESCQIPVLFISATTEQEERVEGLRLGAVDFIAKPFQSDDLLVRVGIHLELSQLRAKLESQVAQRTAELSKANDELHRELGERKRVEQALIRLNREMRAISLCNQTLVRATDEQTLLNDICRIVCEEAGYRMAWVGFVEHDELKTVRPVAWSGFENGYLADARIVWADTERGRGPTGTCIRTGQSRYNQNFAINPEVKPWREAALKRGYHSTIALPLMDERHRTFGALTVYAAEVDAFTPDEIRLLEELASDLAYGIVSLRSRAKRKQAEKELAETSKHAAFLAALLERSSQPFAVAYPDGRLWMFNDAFSQLVGYSREELMAMSWSRDLTPPDWRESEWGELEKLHRTGRPVRYEKEYICKDGTRVPISVFVDLIKEEQGEPECYCAFVSDITERKRAEAKLSRSRQELENLKKAVDEHDIVAITDPHGTLTYVNDRFCTLSKYSREELLGRNPRVLSSGYHSKEFIRNLWETISKGRVWKGTFRNRAKDGSFFWLDTTIVPFLNAKGEPYQYMAIRTDISGLKRTEDSLKAATLSAVRAKAATEEASRAKDRFLAILSHELRTPLTPILALTSALAEDKTFDDALRKDMQSIQRNVELEASLIDDLLDVTRIIHGKIHLDKGAVDLCEVIRRVVGICRADLKVRRIHFGVKTEGEPYPVLADATRLQQVFWNLLKNALKFTPEDGCIGIQCRRDGSRVVAEVTDSGKGIAAEDLSRIFNPFEQIERQESGAYGGLGLGLALSKSLVELHGGTIEARSEGLGKGSVFSVTLPLADASAPLVTIPGTPSTAVNQRALRILLVEDHGDTARILARLLRNQGHEVRTAGDLKKALELSQQWEFDLLISDLGLPDGNGRDLMRQLRSIRPEIPGIAISGFGTADDIRQSLAAGFAEHLVKPVEIAALRAAIQRIASKSGCDHPPRK